MFGVQAVAGAVPFTPGGAGVQQALLVQVFSSSASVPVVAAYSVGQQIAITVLTAGVGLASVVFIFRFRSFKEVVRAGRASQEAERAERDTPPDAGCSGRAGAGEGLAPGRLLKPVARFAHERHGLGEDDGHHGPDLLGLRLGAALQVDRGSPPRPSCRRRA